MTIRVAPKQAAGVTLPISESDVTALVVDLAARGYRLKPTSGTKTANYSAVANDFVPVDTTSGNVTITFPTAPADGTLLGIKQVVRGGTNTVPFTLGGSDVLNVAGGSQSGTITYLNQAILWQYQASTAIWFVIADDLPNAALALIYASLQEPVNTQATITGTYTIPDVTSYTMHRLTLTGSTAFTLPTAGGGKSFMLHTVQDGTGSRVPTFNSVKWQGASHPVASTGANKIDAWSFWCMDGTNWLGALIGLDFS